MFVDEATVTIKGGRGGDGKVAFFRGKNGPCGGNGGRGGDVYAVADSNIPDLKKYIEYQEFKGEAGEAGGMNRRLGMNGADLILKVPVGTTIIDLRNNSEAELKESGDSVLICRGGHGGLGNEAFKTSTYQTPKHAEPGHEGQEKRIKFILKLLADFGFIGIPNAGKSSLLNALTAANVKTANYPFTTLSPNLGVYGGKILADIPGLIEGASSGKGLGIKFLKHIEKVTMLFHCISSESTNLKADYEIVQSELGKYKEELLEKKIIILLTKTDLFSHEEVKAKVEVLKEFGKEVIPLSVYLPESLDHLKRIIEES